METEEEWMVQKVTKSRFHIGLRQKQKVKVRTTVTKSSVSKPLSYLVILNKLSLETSHLISPESFC